MPVRQADAEWRGDLLHGQGYMRMMTGAFSGPYSFGSRFAEEQGTNPEELIAAVHAGCFSMQFAGVLTHAGFVPERVATTARVFVERAGDGFSIARIALETRGKVAGIEEEVFQQLAQEAKDTCPVSRALAGGPEITVAAVRE